MLFSNICREERFLDIFADICQAVNYKYKSDCFSITGKFDEEMKTWYYSDMTKPFLSDFCYTNLRNCNADVLEEAQKDSKNKASDNNFGDFKDELLSEDEEMAFDDTMHAEMEDDFTNIMKEAKEVKEVGTKCEGEGAPESSKLQVAWENILILRDNSIDWAQNMDKKAQQVLNLQLKTHLKPEHSKLALDYIKYWYLVALSLLLAAILPLVFLCKHCCCFKGDTAIRAPVRSANGRRKATRVAVKSDVEESEAVVEDTENDASGEESSGSNTTKSRRVGRPSKAAISDHSSKSQTIRTSRASSRRLAQSSTDVDSENDHHESD